MSPSACTELKLENGAFQKGNSKRVFVLSVPKSGTTWLKALTFSVVTRTHFDNSTTPLLFKDPHNCLPLLEIDFYRKGMKPESGSLPLMASHLSYASLPKSVNDSGCKIVYICREPKDAFVSLWNYARKLPHVVQERCLWKRLFSSFAKEFLILALIGIIYDETLLSVKRMVEFMGYPFSLEEENEGKFRSIVEFCSFENLSNLEINKTRKCSFRKVKLEIGKVTLDVRWLSVWIK
ncbi:hypothetical protein Patl1_06997 [Pistacia atlantica]|uniref:Uncharacterized protein n=1 Tax=Pistacia atlantica TaxID=434234 RepID=A0ACC1AIM3_9ROSI|nr:hypothetical protein Patl1_06997 [Pistacia atlantica]